MRLLLAVMAAVILLTGLGDKDHPVASVDAPNRKGPGTMLGESFSVAPGSRLLGTTFPLPWSPDVSSAPNGSWEALLVVDGDPIDVFNAYVTQAERLGLPMQAMTSSGACALRLRGTLASVALDDRVPSGSKPFILCNAAGASGGTGRPNGRSVRITLWRTSGKTDGLYASHLHLEHVQQGTGTGEAVLDPGRLPGRQTTRRGAEEFAEPPREPRPVGLGGAISNRLAFHGEDTMVRVAEGSHLLAPPSPSLCNPGSFEAVLRVHGAPEEVMDAYTHQFRRHRFQGRIQRGEFRGRPVLAANFNLGGGGYLRAVAVVGDEAEPTFLLVSRCSD